VWPIESIEEPNDSLNWHSRPMSSCIVSFKNQVVFVWWFASALSIEFIFACRASWCGLIPLFRKGLAHEMQILWFDSEMRKPAGIVKICEAEINWDQLRLQSQIHLLAAARIRDEKETPGEDRPLDTASDPGYGMVRNRTLLYHDHPRPFHIISYYFILFHIISYYF